jgi:hypothetical protein
MENEFASTIKGINYPMINAAFAEVGGSRLELVVHKILEQVHGGVTLDGSTFGNDGKTFFDVGHAGAHVRPITLDVYDQSKM